MNGNKGGLVLVLGITLFAGINAGINAGQSVFKKPEIHSLHINSDIRYRFATTTVTSRIKNVDTKSREATFDVTLPNEAFITNLTLEIDGKIINGEIKEKEKAKKQYEAARQRGESAGYIGTIHRETNRFNLAVTVAPQSKVSFNLTYQELLKRTAGHYEQVVYIDPGQPVPDMAVTVAILESREITDLRVPPLRNDVMADIEDLSTVTMITTPTPTTAHVKFVPSIEFQTAQSASGMAGQFVVQYDVEREMDAGDILVVNGYFVHFFAPEGFQPIPNDVMFILDTSGSMTGTKLSQLKTAMYSILDQLNEGDRMNVMGFSGSTSFWKTEMVNAVDEDMKEEAKTHIRSLKAGGWTDIDLALTTGLTFLKDRTTSDGAVRSPVIVFLTDGEATHGVTDKEQILRNIRAHNEIEIPIFSLAFGEHADYDLVKKISIQNNGLGRKIYEASDAAMQISGFYNEISVTLLNNITFKYLDAPVTDVTKHEYANYFNGSEMVISGRLENDQDLNIDKTLTLKIISNSVDGDNILLSGELSINSLMDLSSTDNMTNNGNFEKITEKVWAYLTIKQLLDQELAALDDEEKQGYQRQILELSLKYGFVTPLTSMVVTLPEKNITHNTETETPAERNQNLKPAMWSKSSGLQAPVRTNSMPTGFSAVRMHRKIPQHAGAFMMAPDMDDDIIAHAQPSLSKFGGSSGQRKHERKNRRKKQRKNKQKNRKRKQRKSNDFQFPLRVKISNLEDPLCFNMYDDALDKGLETYVFYSNNNTGLKVDIQLNKTVFGKWTKQGSVKEVHLTSGNYHETLTSKSFETRNFSTIDGLPWEISASGGNSTGPAAVIRVKLDAFTISATSNDGGYLNLLIERSTQNTIEDAGIIGQVYNKKVKVIKLTTKPERRNKKGKMKGGKEKAIVAVDGSKFSLKSKQVRHGTQKCWNLGQQETKLINLKSAQVI